MFPLGVLKKRPINGYVLDSAKVKLLLHFDGNYNDSSPNNVAVTATGNVSISTDSPKFGTGKLQFGNTPRNGTIRTTNSFFDFGNLQKFTISCWIKSGDSNGCIVSTRNTATHTPIELGRGGIFLIGNQSLTNWVYAYFILFTANWSHVAVVGDGTNIKGYRDGILQFSVAHPNWPSQQYPLIFGKNGDNYYSDGMLDDFLLYDDVLWTSNFTPPTAPFSY